MCTNLNGWLATPIYHLPSRIYVGRKAWIALCWSYPGITLAVCRWLFYITRISACEVMLYNDEGSSSLVYQAAFDNFIQRNFVEKVKDGRGAMLS